jgi:hypothetical protein
MMLLMIAAASSAEEHPSLSGAVSAAEIAKANNPLADMNSLNFHDYYTPSIIGVPNETANTLFLRPVMVAGQQIIRMTIPLTTTPTTTGYASGLGDISVFDAILLTPKGASTELALGPLLAMDTATEDALGAGKWQLGGALVAMRPLPGGSLLGCLATYQADVSGDDDRDPVSLLTFQPIATFSIGGGHYARSAGAVWIFDLEHDRYLIPFGIGAGRVFRAAGATVNLFAESEFTVYSRGTGQPALQVFFGMNLQWAKKG